VVVQIAVSLPPLIAAGLFVRSLGQSRHIDLGFRARNVLITTVDTGLQGYAPQQSEALFRQLREGAAALPGVRSAALAYSVPMGSYDLTARVAAEGRLPAAPEAWPAVNYNAVDPAYFATLALPILRGRSFDAHDDRSAPRVAVVNQMLAARLWPAADPIGRRLVLAPDGPALEVVGVAKDGKYGFLYEPPQPFFYVPLAQQAEPLRVLHLSTAVAPASLSPAVRRLLHDLDPTLPVPELRTLEAMLHDDLNAFQLPRLGAWLAGTLGLLGLLLSSVGLYGVVSFTTSRRTHEIGIRMALGAGRPMVLAMVVRQGLGSVVAGLALGLLLTLFAVRSLAALLYGVEPTDPLTFTGVLLLLAAVALLACFLPARRASRGDPMAALRGE
jgi:putative ABC transport system permease protein